MCARKSKFSFWAALLSLLLALGFYMSVAFQRSGTGTQPTSVPSAETSGPGVYLLTLPPLPVGRSRIVIAKSMAMEHS